MMRSKVSRNFVLLAPPSCGEVSANKSANVGALIFIVTLFGSVLIIAYHPPFVQRFLNFQFGVLTSFIHLRLLFIQQADFFQPFRNCRCLIVCRPENREVRKQFVAFEQCFKVFTCMHCSAATVGVVRSNCFALHRMSFDLGLKRHSHVVPPGRRSENNHVVLREVNFRRLNLAHNALF